MVMVLKDIQMDKNSWDFSMKTKLMDKELITVFVRQ